MPAGALPALRHWSIAVIALVLAFACKRAEPPKPAEVSMKVERASTATVTSRYVSSGPRISGTLQPQQTASILAETGGTVTSVSANEGQSVSRGAPLATISDQTAADAYRSAQVAEQSARTAVAVARRDLDRATTLAGAGALPRRDIDVGRAQLANAQAQLGQAISQVATARERLGNQSVTASTSGVISEKRVSTGDIVTPGTPLFTIVDLGTLQLEANVPADAIAQINPGTAVSLEVRGYPNEQFPGTITRISPTVDAGTGQVRVFVAMPNQGRRLVGGLFAEGTVTAQSRRGLVIPIDALDESGATPTVIRVRNGVTERVTVQLGIRNEAEGFVEVLSGLNEGDTVLIGPARTIAPGTKVVVG